MDLGPDWSRDDLHFEDRPQEVPVILLGPREKGPGAEIVYTDGEVSFRYTRIALKPLFITFTVLMSLAVLIALTGDKQSDAQLAVPIAMALVAIFIVIPAVILISLASNRRFADRPALLQLRTGDETVTLPHLDLQVQWNDLYAVTEVAGWYAETSNEQTRIRQFGLIWRTDTGFRMVPLANVSHGGRRLGGELAELLQLPLLATRVPWFDLRSRKRQKRT